MKTFFLIASLALAAIGASAQDPSSDLQSRATVEGFVRQAGTNEPIENATVVLDPGTACDAAYGRKTVTPAPVWQKAQTDSAGHFVFRNVVAHAYSVTARRKGYFGDGPRNGSGNDLWAAEDDSDPKCLGATDRMYALDDYGDYPDRVFTHIAVSSEQPIDGLILRLIPSVTISGRVLHPDGAPVVGTTVSTRQPTYSRTGRPSYRQKSGTTNDLGEYRIAGLPPGRYHVVAYYPYRFMREPVYFPGVSNEALATRITAAAGAEFTGIDVALPPLPETPFFTISGTVTGGPPDRGDPTVVQFFVAQRDSNDGSRAFLNEAPDRSTGRFQIRGIPAGDYDIYPILSDDFDESRRYATRTPVVIRDRSIENVHIDLQPAPDLRIRLRLDGEPPAGFDSAEDFLKDLSPALFSRGPSVFGNWLSLDDEIDSATGEGQFRGVPPATYQILLNWSGMYVADVLQGGQSVLNDGFIIDGGHPDPLEIIIRTNVGTVEGTVEDGRHESVADASVVLVPEPSNRRSLDYPTARSDEDGHFTIEDVPPGEYTLFARTAVPSRAWLNPDFLSGYESRGQRLRVEGGETTAAHLTVIPEDVP